jgi:hypothetical protein
LEATLRIVSARSAAAAVGTREAETGHAALLAARHERQRTPSDEGAVVHATIVIQVPASPVRGD